jgi:hypothetical protein
MSIVLAYCPSRMEAYCVKPKKKKPALEEPHKREALAQNEAQKIRVYTLWYMTKCSTRKIRKKMANPRTKKNCTWKRRGATKINEGQQRLKT